MPARLWLPAARVTQVCSGKHTRHDQPAGRLPYSPWPGPGAGAGSSAKLERRCRLCRVPGCKDGRDTGEMRSTEGLYVYAVRRRRQHTRNSLALQRSTAEQNSATPDDSLVGRQAGDDHSGDLRREVCGVEVAGVRLNQVCGSTRRGGTAAGTSRATAGLACLAPSS